MAGVKGIFFTFGGFFLVMLVLVLSLLVVTTLQQSNTRLTESGSIERVYMLDRSLHRTIADMDNGLSAKLQWNTGLNLSIVSIAENLDTDFDDYNSYFYSEMQELSSFVESDQPEIKFNLSLIHNSEEKNPVQVKPHDFKYTHLNREGRNILTVYPGTYLPTAGLMVVLSNETLIDPPIDWTIQNPGNFTFNVTVTDNESNTSKVIEGLNPALVNEFIVNGNINITVGALCYSCIEFDRDNSNVTISLVTYLPYAAEQVMLTYPRGLYEINFTDLGVYLNATPRII